MKKRIKTLALLLSLWLAFSATACTGGGNNEGGGNNGGDSSVNGGGTSVVDPDPTPTPDPTPDIEVTLTLGKHMLELTEDEFAFLTYTSNASRTPEWYSSNTAVASVSVAGKVIAKTAGTATVTAKIGSTADSCVVTVSAGAAETDDYIDADKELYLSLKDENTPKIDVTYMEVNASGETANYNKNFTFRSLNTSIATVDDEGTVTPVGLGSTDIEVKCGSVSTLVKADVYTELITTPEEWLAMIDKDDLFARYYLVNDLDFSGVTYSTTDNAGNESGFTGELNGGYHTLSNITVTGNGTQSLLGGAYCAKVRNIAFKGVKFTSSGAAGICTSLIQHRDKSKFGDRITVSGDTVKIDGKVIDGAYEYSDMKIVIFPAIFNNIILDAEFVGHGNAAFCQNFYGGQLSNMYFNLRRGGTDDFTESDYEICKTTYIWSGQNAVSNVVICIPAGTLQQKPAITAIELPMTNVSHYTSSPQANHAAANMFDTNVFFVPATGVPSFVAEDVK